MKYDIEYMQVLCVEETLYLEVGKCYLVDKSWFYANADIYPNLHFRSLEGKYVAHTSKIGCISLADYRNDRIEEICN